MQKLSSTLFLVLNVIIILNGQVQSNFDSLSFSLTEEITQIVADHEVPGMTLSVLFSNGEVIRMASGVSNKLSKEAMAPNDLMLSGSVGKMFVSVIFHRMMLQENIDLNEPIRKYLGEEYWFESLPNANDIRIRDLLQHTSGLPRYIFTVDFLEDFKSDPMQEISPVQCVEYILEMEAIHPAGKGWGYSDTNYILLGLIFEKVTGRSYNDALRAFIIEQNFEFTRPSDERRLPGLVQGHIGSQNFFDLPEQTKENEKLVVNPAFEWTGGGLLTNPYDLAKFIWLVHEKPLIHENQYQQYITPVSFAEGVLSDEGYALGSFVWDRNGSKYYGHSGFFPGYLSYVEYSKEFGYSFAFQINTDEVAAQLASYAQSIREIIEAFIPFHR